MVSCSFTPFNRWENTNGGQDPHLGYLTPKPPSEHPGSAASQGNVTLRKVTGTQAKSENKKNLQAMAMLKLLGRRFLSDSEITFCGHLSERTKWKFPGLWPTLSFTSKSLWAWGERGAQNFKLFSPGERGHQVPCMYYHLRANHSTRNHDNKPQRLHVGPSFRWET